jgi:hypothetical protein
VHAEEPLPVLGRLLRGWRRRGLDQSAPGPDERHDVGRGDAGARRSPRDRPRAATARAVSPAIAAEPMLPPIVRMLAFMPLATPVKIPPRL